jgi:hypothetical protein
MALFLCDGLAEPVNSDLKLLVTGEASAVTVDVVFHADGTALGVFCLETCDCRSTTASSMIFKRRALER